MDVAMGDYLLEALVLLAQNPVALMSVVVSIALMFTLAKIYDH
jgi:hypothetical protein